MTDPYAPGGGFYSEPRPSPEPPPRSGVILVYALLAFGVVLVLTGLIVMRGGIR